MITKKRIAGMVAGVIATVYLLPAAAGAITTITQGYLTTEKAPLGAIMSLKTDSADYVSRANTGNANNILGVVVSEGNSLLTLSDGKANQVQVATSGVVQVSVSNINGDIASGDAITASPIKGVGMKATTNAKVVGIAQESLSGNGTSEQSYTDKDGRKRTVLLGQVPVLVNPAYYYKQPDKTVIPAAVQNVANALAGKAVNSLPVIISLAIFIVTLIIVVSIIYSMIHSSIISVGRNPMSQAAIYRNLIQMSGLIILILAVSVVSIYMVLTKIS
ncbi:MAG TPA: hypothetical protein VFX84_02155 [Candidatus Saccharimonadales bacterium]|nr:hypothetical protein [Candidatus Saccharimonadales bacterium]